MQYRSALLVPMFPQTAITYRGSLLVYAPLMGIYLIRIEVLLLRSLSPDCSAQVPKGRHQVIVLEPLMEICLIGNEISVLRSLSADCPAKRKGSCYDPRTPQTSPRSIRVNWSAMGSTANYPAWHWLGNGVACI